MKSPSLVGAVPWFLGTDCKNAVRPLAQFQIETSNGCENLDLSEHGAILRVCEKHGLESFTMLISSV